MVELVWLH